MRQWYGYATAPPPSGMMPGGGLGWKPHEFWRATVAELIGTIFGFRDSVRGPKPMLRDEFEEWAERNPPSPSIRKQKQQGRR